MQHRIHYPALRGLTVPPHDGSPEVAPAWMQPLNLRFSVTGDDHHHHQRNEYTSDQQCAMRPDVVTTLAQLLRHVPGDKTEIGDGGVIEKETEAEVVIS